MTARDEIRELRATIQAITGKVPQSTSVDYLRKRVAMLVPPAQTVDGHTLIGQLGGGSAVGSLKSRALFDTIGVNRAMVVSEIAKLTKQDPIDIINRAIDEHAVRQGFGALVERMKRTP